jgi:hypothetical protein
MGWLCEEIFMRFLIVAAFTASVVLAMPAMVSAQTAQQSSDTSNVAADRSMTGGPVPDGITTSQEGAIPYHPCTIALGWVNGRLQCRNNY